MTSMDDRMADFPVDPLFLERWSPRAFDKSAITEHDLMTLFEAARWAPSSYNAQPWRFVFALRDTPSWTRFLDLLNRFNRSWAANAAAIIFVISDRMIQTAGDVEPLPSRSHSFDAGAAWALLALQATRLGLHTHGMVGVDFERAHAELAVPDRFQIEMAVAVGRRANESILPSNLREREKPTGRIQIAEFAFEGRMRV